MTHIQHSTIAVIDLAANNLHAPAGTHIDIASRAFHGLSLLEWTVRRLSESTMIDQFVITGLPSYLPAIQSASLCGAKWMPSLQNDPLHRVYEVAERTQATWLVLVSPTCPFLDPALLDRLVKSAWNRPEADFVGFMASKHPRYDLSRLGLVSEICTRQALRQAIDRKLDTTVDIVNVFRSHPNLFQMRWVPLPEALDRSDLRFALETAEDWEQAYSYVEAAGDDLSWQRLVELVGPKEDA
jgi:spore coat polysaccharide biosynthesis protein SpsF (cytidylyltransferase family)